MPNKRSPSQEARDKRKIAKLYLEGHTQFVIAEKCKLSQGMISNILASLRKEWQESSLLDMDERKLIELNKIDKLEVEYWAAWKRSRRNAVTVVEKELGFDTIGGEVVSKNEITTHTKGQVGDKKFLDGVEWCIERRCKIFGIDAPKKTAEFDASEKMSWAEFIGNNVENTTKGTKGA